MGLPNYLPRDHEGMQVYSTPAHEGLQAVEQYPDSYSPQSYQGVISPLSYQGVISPLSYQGMISPQGYQTQQIPQSYQGQQSPHSDQAQQNPYHYQGQIQPDAVPLSSLGDDKTTSDGTLPAYPERTICGLAVRTFWTIFGIAALVVVVAAAVGGGIGGSQAARHAQEANDAAAARFVPFNILLQIPSTTCIEHGRVQR